LKEQAVGTPLIDHESLILEDQLRLAHDELAELLGEHAQDCDGSERCRTCRDLHDDRLPNRLAYARLEYSQKALRLVRDTYGEICIYCGGSADQRDHLLPRGWTGEGVRKLVPTVPACGNCNGTINDHPSPVIAERSGYVAGRIRIKHARQLRINDRTESELEEFGEHMGSRLRAAQNKRQVLRARLIVLDLGGLPEVPESWLCLLAEGEYSGLLRDFS
jgi:hypothetical protein